MPGGGPGRGWAGLLVAACLLACPAAQLTPAKPTVDTTRTRSVYIRCWDPVTSTSLTSPVFDQYLSNLRQDFTRAAPLYMTALCKRQRVSGGSAVCQYGLANARASGALAALTQLQGLPSLLLQSCSLALGGGAAASSASCFTDDTEAAPVVASDTPQTELSPTQFSVNLLDNNAAVGGTRAGPMQVSFSCSYYTPAELTPQPITLASLAASGTPPPPAEQLQPATTPDVVPSQPSLSTFFASLAG